MENSMKKMLVESIKSQSELLTEVVAEEIDTTPIIDNLLLSIRKLDKADKDVFGAMDNLWPNLYV